ncbi:MAG: TCR/Tet family MFS transporter [Hyphomonadaceae bacterium]|nr:TCR/Tet family MFS transporter [Hyphomonadaceae bacterium]
MKPASDKRALAFILLAMLIDSMGFGIVMPVLPQLLVELTGVSVSQATRQAGWLLVTFAALQFACSPLLGALSDRFGRRPVLLLSMFAFSLNYVLMAAAPDLAWLFLGRAIAGISGALYAPANAYIADITPPQARAQRFGLVGAAFGLGFILGPALGGLIGQFGTRAPFYVAGALAGLNVIFGFFALPESLAPQNRRAFSLARANPFGALRALARHKGVLPIIAVLVLWNLSVQVYPTTWAFWATLRFDFSPAEIGATLAYTGLLMASVQIFLTGRIVSAFGEQRAALFGFVSLIIPFLLYMIIDKGWMVYAVGLLAFFQGVGGPALNALISQRVPSNAQGELQGGVASLNGLAAIVGPWAFTETLSRATAPGLAHPFAGAAFVLAAAIAACALLLFLFVTRKPAAVPQPDAVA